MISLSGIIFFTIKTRRVIDIPYSPTFTDDALTKTFGDKPGLLLKMNIGSSYQWLSFSYMAGVSVIYMIFIKIFSGLGIGISFYLVSFCICILWTKIRIKGRYTLEESWESETGEGEVKAYRLKLLPLPLWIDLSFIAGSILLAVLISILLSR